MSKETFSTYDDYQKRLKEIVEKHPVLIIDTHCDPDKDDYWINWEVNHA
ncbi:MAG: hypothetical protein ACFFDI_25035 [Promethearchaeota archaeon]